ncbi:hypothetical protein H0H93_004152, partial [Arthromyces matolae]
VPLFTDDNIKRYIMLQPLLRILTKSPSSSIQTVLHALFLPTPFKVLLKAAPKGTAVKDGTPIDSTLLEMPEEVLKPGALYAECAVVRLNVAPPPSETHPTEQKKSQKDAKKKEGLQEVLEIPDDGDYGGEL